MSDVDRWMRRIDPVWQVIWAGAKVVNRSSGWRRYYARLVMRCLSRLMELHRWLWFRGVEL